MPAPTYGMRETKRIALVYDAIFPYVKGGAERRYYELGQRLAAKGHEVHLYGMKYWDGPRMIEREGLYLHGICRARPLYTKSGRRSIGQALVFGFSCLSMMRARYDCIDCCGFPYFSLFAVKLSALARGKPLYATWHEVWGRDYWQQYLGRLGVIGYMVERSAVKLPNAIIAVSPDTAGQLRQKLKYQRTIHTVTNGVDYEGIQTITPAGASYDVMYAGRLLDHKNIDLLIRAVAILKQRRTQVSAAIIGDGPERGRLEQLATDLELERNIHWLGFRPDHQDVYALMKTAKVFVLPSSREGFGIVVLEANAAGVPVVTIDHPSNAAKSLVQDRNGLVAEATAEDLAAKILQLLAPNNGTSPASCRDFAAQYDWSRTASALERILV